MSELKVFQNEEFGAVRTMTINGEPYFVGKDVADILGYSNSRKALIDHVDEEDKNTVTIRDGSRDGLHLRFFPLSANTVCMLLMRF